MVFSIYVWNYSPDTPQETIRDFFTVVTTGEPVNITELSFKKDETITKALKFDYEDEEKIQLAKLLHGAPLEGTQISVSDQVVWS